MCKLKSAYTRQDVQVAESHSKVCALLEILRFLMFVFAHTWVVYFTYYYAHIDILAAAALVFIRLFNEWK